MAKTSTFGEMLLKRYAQDFQTLYQQSRIRPPFDVRCDSCEGDNELCRTCGGTDVVPAPAEWADE